MPSYRVPLIKRLYSSVTVEAEDETTAIEQAFDSDNFPGQICAQCGGWGQEWWIDEDEWDVDDDAGVEAVDEWVNGE